MDLLYLLVPMAACALVMFVCMRLMMAMRRRSTGPAVRQAPQNPPEEEVAPHDHASAPGFAGPERDPYGAGNR